MRSKGLMTELCVLKRIDYFDVRCGEKIKIVERTMEISDKCLLISSLRMTNMDTQAEQTGSS